MNVFEKFGCPRAGFVPLTEYPVTEDDVKVIDGLSYSVSEMVDLVKQGLPVNSVNAQSMMLQPGQGVPNPSWEVAPESVRGFDIADAWELQQLARNKIADFYKKSKESQTPKIE